MTTNAESMDSLMELPLDNVVNETELEMRNSLTDLTENEQPIARSLFRSFVDTVSDVTFGSPIIAKFIQDGLLSFSDRVLRNDETFSWWITSMISHTAKTILSVEGACGNERSEFFSNLEKLSPFLAQKENDNVKRKLSSSSCNKCRSIRSKQLSKSPTSTTKIETTETVIKAVNNKKCPGTQCPKRKRMQCEYEAQAKIVQNCRCVCELDSDDESFNIGSKTTCKMRINRVMSKKTQTFRRARSTTSGSANCKHSSDETHACYISEDKKCVCFIFKKNFF